MMVPFGINYKTRKREQAEAVQRDVCEDVLDWLLGENSPLPENPLVRHRLVIPVCLLFTRKPFKFEHSHKTIVTLDPGELSEIARLTGEVEFIELFTCQLRNAKKSAIVLFAFDTLKRGEYIDPSNLRSRKKVELQLTRNGWEITNFKI